MSVLKMLWREILRRPAASTSGETDKESGAATVVASDDAYRLADASTRSTMLDALSLDLRDRPGSQSEWARLGDWSLDRGRLDQAEAAFRKALHLQPMHARAQEGLGLALLNKGHLDEAYLRLEAATKLAPANAEAWIHWGLVDLETGRLDAAAEKFQRGIDRAPGNSHGWHNLALVAMKRGDTGLAIELFERAIELKPDHGLAYSNLALALTFADRLVDASAAAARAIELKPGNARVRVVQADVFIAWGDATDAAAALDHAEAIEPSDVGAKICRAKLALLQGHLDEAAKAFDAALLCDPANAEARTGLGQLLLQRGDWGAGWTYYEARRETATTPVRQVPLPEWQGEDCRGRGVLVHAEQGMGDVILFLSCLSELHDLGANIVLDVPQRLAVLAGRAFPWVEIVCSDAQIQAVGWHAAKTALDMHVPIGSLPRWFRRRPEEFPGGHAYLHADPRRVESWRQELASSGRPVVGLAWRGGLPITGKYQRSLDLHDMTTALADSGATFVSLQHGDPTSELADVRAHAKVDIHPGLSGYVDLDDLAALTKACDAVVTVCSTQAHLTGALGVPGLVLVPVASNWRYGREGTVSPWYASLTFARQIDADDWSVPLSDARAWLGTLRTPT